MGTPLMGLLPSDARRLEALLKVPSARARFNDLALLLTNDKDSQKQEKATILLEAIKAVRDLRAEVRPPARAGIRRPPGTLAASPCADRRRDSAS